MAALIIGDDANSRGCVSRLLYAITLSTLSKERMMFINSKTKGNIGESIVLAEFVKRGIQVSVPFGDNARYDLIADFNGKLNKIQVKYCNQHIINGSVTCPCASSTNHTTNKHYTTYQNDIDYFAFYIVALNQTVLVPIEIIGNRKSICIRIDEPKNNQNEKITYASDYSIDKVITTSS